MASDAQRSGNYTRKQVTNRAGFWKRVKIAQSCPTLGLSSPWNSPGQNTGVGGLSLLQGIFPIQGLNPGLPHCRWILYQLGHKGSPRILEGVAFPFSRESSLPRNRTGVSCIAGGFFTNWAIRGAPFCKREMRQITEWDGYYRSKTSDRKC